VVGIDAFGGVLTAGTIVPIVAGEWGAEVFWQLRAFAGRGAAPRERLVWRAIMM